MNPSGIAAAPKPRKTASLASAPATDSDPSESVAAPPRQRVRGGPPALGTEAWVKEVFASGPVRTDLLRKTYLHRTSMKIDEVRRHITGSLPVIACYLLSYLQRRGIVQRWKEYPFFWPSESPYLTRSSPTFLAQLPDGLLVVIRIKATRYLTADLEKAFEWERKATEAAGMKYLLWTEKHPLDTKCRELQLRLRAANEASFDEQAMSDLVKRVDRESGITAGALADAGIDTSLLAPAITRGLLYVHLGDTIHERTLVTSKPQHSLRAYLLGSKFDPQSWWNSLKRRVA